MVAAVLPLLVISCCLFSANASAIDSNRKREVENSVRETIDEVVAEVVKDVVEEVGVGERKEIQSDDIILSACGLSDSVALAVLYNWKNEEEKFQNRTLFHITGGNVTMGYFFNPHAVHTQDATADIQDLTRKIKKASDAVIIIGFGVSCSQEESQKIFLRQNGTNATGQPVLDLLSHATTTHMGVSHTLQVLANGKMVFVGGKALSSSVVQELIAQSREVCD